MTSNPPSKSPPVQDDILIGLKSAISDVNFIGLQHFMGLLKERDEKNGSCTLNWEDGNLLLRKALEHQLNRFADVLLDYGVHVNRSQNQPCNTALHLALKHDDNLEMIEKLLIRGANINAKNSRSKSALYVAVEKNDDQVVEMMLKYNNTQLNFKNQRKWIVIDLVASKGNEKIFNLLVNCGAQVNLKHLDSNNLFHVAVEKGYPVAVEKIIDEKKYDITDPKNKQVLTVAINNFKEQPYTYRYQAIVKKLLVDAKFPLEPEIITDADFIFEIAKKGYITILDDLLKMGADPNIVSSSNGCPLIVEASGFSNVDIIKRLLAEKTININAKDSNGKTLLNCAILNLHSSIKSSCHDYEQNCENKFLDDDKTCHSNEWFDIIKILINRGIDVNSRIVKTMITPLHSVATECYYTGSFYYVIELCKLLISAGADLVARDVNGNTPLQHAVTTRRTEMVELLLSQTKIDNNYLNNKKQTLLHSAAMTKSSRILKILLKLKEFKDLEVKDIDGNTPLILAIRSKQGKAVEILLQYGADVNASNEKMMTPLHYSIENEHHYYFTSRNSYEHKKIIEILLKHGANPNCVDMSGRTPLLTAAEKNDDDTVKLLIKYKADVNLRSGMSGKTVLHYLAECKNKVSFNILKYGADINGLTNDKKTALDCLMQSIVSYRKENSNTSLSIQIIPMKYSDPKFCENAYALIKYILQRHVINYFICQENLYAIDEYEDKYGWVKGLIQLESEEEIKVIKIDELRKMCEREVELMRQYTFKNTNVNVYQILMKCPHRLAKYVLKNDNVIYQLQAPVFFDKFPMYRDMLSLRIGELLARKKMLDQDVDYSFHCIFRYLPFVCIEEILSFLDNQDLKSLISACQLITVCQASVCNTSILKDEVEGRHKDKKLKI